MKKLAILIGAKTLTSDEQKSINGGFKIGDIYFGGGCRAICPPSCTAMGGTCVPCIEGPFQGVECRIFN